MSYYKRINKILAEEKEILDDEADSALMSETEKVEKYGPIVKTFKSKSNPNKAPYEVRRIKGQNPTCNCRGWTTHRKCVHTDEVKRLHIAASAVADLVNKYFSKKKVLSNLNDPHSKEFLAEFTSKHGKYKGWEFDYQYGGYLSYGKGDLIFFFTPDYNDDGYLDIQLSEADGDPIDEDDIEKKSHLPHRVKYQEPLTPDKLFGYVKPLLDKLEHGDKDIKCECGGDKARTPHSTWCPKYQK